MNLTAQLKYDFQSALIIEGVRIGIRFSKANEETKLNKMQ